MTSTPVSFRLPPKLGANPDPDLANTITVHDDAINDLQQAIPALKSQIDALKTGTSSGTSSSTTEQVSTETVVQVVNSIGFVNDQAGVTTYQTQQSDSGSLIVLDDASAIAVTLATVSSVPAIQLPWSAAFLNLGAGTATLTPATGTISYAGHLAAGSMPIAQGQFALVWFDGVNFWAFLATLAPSGLSVTITTAALTTLGTQGSMTYVGGILTSQMQAT